MIKALMLCALGIPSLCMAADTTYDTYPPYRGNDLEVTVDGDSTRFALWSPAARAVRLSLYDHDLNTPATAVHDMTLTDNGVWRKTLPGRLYGTFYTFTVLDNDRWLDPTPGVWAKAVGTNGRRAAVIDLDTTDPDGWADDRGPALESLTDAVIYEMHHRDFSISPTSGITHKGKFLALTEPGTRSPQGLATGIDHLKELGVTHVHILPSYDYNSVDEANLQQNTYNWGYDPQNYNAPEGSYSTDPANPGTRINEMKQMVKALHDAGIGVIMDVVYNHTGSNEGSNFSLTAPGYYYRHRPDGSWSDASGCGNETASERPQMGDYIVNSVKYWADEYHIDGFRFDLMAIHDTETMNRVADELKTIRPDIFVYGEGWTAGDSPLPVERRALKDNAMKMPAVAVFSDDLRDAVKGHYSNAADRGFATGKPGNAETVKIGIVGATAHPQVDYTKGNNSRAPYALNPTQVINYVSCHDDLMLTDKLAKSMPGSPTAQRQRAARLAQTIVFTSQGTPFMFAGEEIFRDKQGVHNSYNSPDSVNAIDWTLKDTNIDQYEYYRQLIRLRKEHPAFRLRTADQVARHLKFDNVDNPNVVSYSLTGNAGGDTYNEIKVIFNGSDTPYTATVPRGNWTVLALDGVIDADGVGTVKGGRVTVPPVSAYIIAR